MAHPRFFSPVPLAPELAGTAIELDESVAHHAARVLRLAVGDPITLFDGTGGEYEASLERIDKRGAGVRLLRHLPAERESHFAVTLVQAVAANDAMDYAIRKATELGVTSIQPLVTARSAPLPAGERAGKRLAHWRQIAIAACEQCGRNRVPDVLAPRQFADWLGSWQGSGIMMLPDGSGVPAAIGQPVPPLALLIGPEGGFDARECAAAQAKGFHALRLGPRVLRTDTAATAGLAVVQLLWGDWR